MEDAGGGARLEGGGRRCEVQDTNRRNEGRGVVAGQEDWKRRCMKC